MIASMKRARLQLSRRSGASARVATGRDYGTAWAPAPARSSPHFNGTFRKGERIWVHRNVSEADLQASAFQAGSGFDQRGAHATREHTDPLA
jgi:hypothetical protein